MSNSSSNLESFDLSRLTLVGWILSLLSSDIFFVYTFGLINIIKEILEESDGSIPLFNL